MKAGDRDVNDLDQGPFSLARFARIMTHPQQIHNFSVIAPTINQYPKHVTTFAFTLNSNRRLSMDDLAQIPCKRVTTACAVKGRFILIVEKHMKCFIYGSRYGFGKIIILGFQFFNH
jgi:hypothetical protein